MTEFGSRDVVDVTSRLFLELGRQNSLVLVEFGQCMGDFVRLAGREGESFGCYAM